MAILDELPILECEKKLKWSGRLIQHFVKLRAVVLSLAEGSGFIFSNGSRAMVSDATGNLAESAVTATELSYLDGVTSNVQTQLNSKVPKGYGGLSVTGNTTALALASQDTWYQYTYFDTNDAASGLTPDHTNDHITVAETGVYYVSVSCSFSGSASTDFEVQVFVNNGNTGKPNVHFERMLAATGDIGSGSASGVVSLTAADTVELWVQRTDGGGTSKDFVGRDVTLSVIRLA